MFVMNFVKYLPDKSALLASYGSITFSFVALPPGLLFQPSLAIKIPPKRTKGVAKKHTIAILHSKKPDTTIPVMIAKKDSEMVATVSVVSPLRLEISSESTLERIPGALSFLSYQEMVL